MIGIDPARPLDPHDERLLEHVRPPGWRNPEPAPLYDLVVIGGGTAGLVCAAGAAGLGARVALVERGRLGGDCLNTGCVPSKALLRSARAIDQARRGAAVGVPSTAAPDFSAVMARVRARRADLAPHDSAARLASLGVDVFFGEAAFDSRRSVRLGEQALRFRRAVIATGGRPVVPDVVADADGAALRIRTSENLFELTEQPRRMIVLGGGPIGCEMAQAFALLGTAVTLVESAPRILPREDPDAAAIVARALAGAGVAVRAGSALEPGDLEGADTVLAAAGRAPNIDALRLEAADVRYDRRGVQVDDRLRTSNARVFAAGDVCSPFRFTHAADAMARIVVQNALFFGRRRMSALVIPWCTYTIPEVGHVGIGPDQAAEEGAETITIPLTGIDRAVVDDETDGFVRIHHRRGRIRGATIVAPHAGELIGQVAAAMRRGGRVADFSFDIFPYPTLADALRRAGDTSRRAGLTPTVRGVLRTYFRLLRR